MTTEEHWASRRPALFSPVYICPISMAPSKPTTSSSWSLRSERKQKPCKLQCLCTCAQFHVIGCYGNEKWKLLHKESFSVLDTLLKVTKRWPTFETLSLTRPWGAVEKDVLSAYSKTEREEWILSQIMPKNIPVVFNINKLNVIPHVYMEHFTSHIRHLAANTHFNTINKVWGYAVKHDFVKLLEKKTLEIMELKFLNLKIRLEALNHWVNCPKS